MASLWLSFWEFREGTGLAQVGVSIDGGATWENIPFPQMSQGFWTFDLSAWAGHPSLQLRFHYRDDEGGYWILDNVELYSCRSKVGGFVYGQTLDAKTRQPLEGARISADAHPDEEQTESVATPADPNTPDGFYRMLVTSDGGAPVHLSAVSENYGVDHAALALPPGGILRHDFQLPAAQFGASPALTFTLGLGEAKQARLTLTNSGAFEGGVHLYEWPTPGLNDQLAAQWDGSTVPPYPLAVAYLAAAAMDGKVYAVGGLSEAVYSRDAHADGYVYDPEAGAWTALAPLAEARYGHAMAALDGKLYVVGGSDAGDNALASLEIYDPDTDTWTAGAPLPHAFSGLRAVALSGQLYVLGGLDEEWFGDGSVYRYDPASDQWTSLAPMPLRLLRGYDLDGSTPPDVPWLALGQDTVILDAGAEHDVMLDLSTNGITRPGRYQAEIRVINDSPYGEVQVPVTLNVNWQRFLPLTGTE